MLRPEPQDLQALFDLSVDVLIVIDSENLYAYNPAASSAFGYPPEWVQEHNFLEVVHPDDREATIASIAEAMGGTTTIMFENRIITASGEILWIQWSSRMDPVTQRVYSVGRDITNIRVNRERLQRYADLLERTQAELKEAIGELTRVSNTDQLTGILNRRAFEARAHEELSRAERTGRPLAVAMMDIDHFKSVNDTHGHPTGDVVLREVARRLDNSRRNHDILGRWGGEEFIALFPDVSVDEARTAVERMTLSVAARPITVGSLSLPVRLSAGVSAQTVTPGTNLSQLLATADQALLRAKELGRDRVEVARPPATP